MEEFGETPATAKRKTVYFEDLEVGDKFTALQDFYEGKTFRKIAQRRYGDGEINVETLRSREQFSRELLFFPGHAEVVPVEEISTIGDSGIDTKPHYYDHPTIWGLQAVDVIQDFSYNKATAMGYIWRSGRKPGEDEVKDLKKARDHIDFEISRIERLRSQSTNKA